MGIWNTCYTIVVHIRHRAVGTFGVSEASRTSCLPALALDLVPCFTFFRDSHIQARTYWDLLVARVFDRFLRRLFGHPFYCPTWDLCSKRWQKVTPNATSKRPREHSHGHGQPLRNIWYLLCGQDNGPPGVVSETALLFACCAGACFWQVLRGFCQFRCHQGVQNDLLFRAEVVPGINKTP